MPLTEAQILEIINANKELGVNPNKIEATDLAKIINAVEDSILSSMGPEFSVSGTPGEGKVVKYLSGIPTWGDDLTSTPGATATLDQTLTAGNITDKTIIFNEDLAAPTVEGQAVNHQWFRMEPLTNQTEGATFYWWQAATKQGSAINEVMHFGWNLGAGGGPQNAAIPGLGESWESNYNPEGSRLVEKHEFYITPNTFTTAPSSQVRLSSYTINSVTGNIDYYKTISRWYLKRPFVTDSTYISVNPSGNGAQLRLSRTETSFVDHEFDYTNGYTVTAAGFQTGKAICNFASWDEFKTPFFQAGTFGIRCHYDLVNFFGGTRVGTSEYPFKSIAYRENSAAPTTSQIEDGYFQVWHNTSNSETRLYANVNGTLKSVLLS